MRIYLDTEFIEDGHTIDLVSIGLVREDGAEYYAESLDADHDRASDWVKDNVLRHLRGPMRPRATIAADIVRFVGDKPEFWAWYADYDWVVLCQLYGTMLDLPAEWPMFCRDLRQLTDSAGLPEQDGSDGPEHHALSDARWLARAHAALLSAEAETTTQDAAINAAHLAHQREWSERTFGPGVRLGVIDHIRKELTEVEDDPTVLEEWVDVIILGFDGAWRAGHEAQAIIDAIKAKQAKNEARTWPDWRTASRDSAIEHVRTEEPS